MAVILVINPGQRVSHYLSGVDGAGNVRFSENPADALVFVDAAAATAFSSGKSINGAVQQTVSGLRNHGKKSINE